MGFYCGGAPLGDGECAHRPLVATLTMATAPRALTESGLSDTGDVPRGSARLSSVDVETDGEATQHLTTLH